MQAEQKKYDPVIIKKYANRRLYNTQTSSYITLEDVSLLVKEGTDFEVRDAKSGEDLTRQILTQIIFELESKGNSMLPVSFLKRMITMYDGSMSEILPHYLEKSMEGFVANQERIRSYVDETWKNYNPINQLGEISRQNMEIMSNAFKMFNPFDAYFNESKNAEANEKKTQNS
jgi:polyhydroxyalkanoate synthesis repressor PhaR